VTGAQRMGCALVGLAVAGCFDVASLQSGRDLAAPPDGGLACPSGAIFCDDFESGDVSRWDGLNPGGAGVTEQVDGTRPLHGNYALHATAARDAPDGGVAVAGAVLGKQLPNPATTGTIAAREYVYLSALPTGSGTVLLDFDGPTFANLISASSSSGKFTVGGTLGGHGSQVDVPVGRWFCLELVVDVRSDTTGRVQLYLDGAASPIVDASGTTLPANQSYAILQAGLLRVDGTVAFDAWFDDVALAAQRVGCE
jgi:hypothetical protein